MSGPQSTVGQSELQGLWVGGKAKSGCVGLQGFLVAQTVSNLPAMQKTQLPSLGWEDPLEKGMATHSSISCLENPWIEEPGGLYSVGLQRVRHH